LIGIVNQLQSRDVHPGEALAPEHQIAPVIHHLQSDIFYSFQNALPVSRQHLDVVFEEPASNGEPRILPFYGKRGLVGGEMSPEITDSSLESFQVVQTVKEKAKNLAHEPRVTRHLVKHGVDHRTSGRGFSGEDRPVGTHVWVPDNRLDLPIQRIHVELEVVAVYGVVLIEKKMIRHVSNHDVAVEQPVQLEEPFSPRCAQGARHLHHLLAIRLIEGVVPGALRPDPGIPKQEAHRKAPMPLIGEWRPFALEDVTRHAAVAPEEALVYLLQEAHCAVELPVHEDPHGRTLRCEEPPIQRHLVGQRLNVGKFHGQIHPPVSPHEVLFGGLDLQGPLLEEPVEPRITPDPEFRFSPPFLVQNPDRLVALAAHWHVFQKGIPARSGHMEVDLVVRPLPLGRHLFRDPTHLDELPHMGHLADPEFPNPVIVLDDPLNIGGESHGNGAELCQGPEEEERKQEPRDRGSQHHGPQTKLPESPPQSGHHGFSLFVNLSLPGRRSQNSTVHCSTGPRGRPPSVTESRVTPSSVDLTLK